MSSRRRQQVGAALMPGSASAWFAAPLRHLAHHRFRQKLEWMCRKHGKRLVVANEAYTGRTRSWDGFVDQNLGGARTVSDGSIVVDRDINGARGIMLRALYGNLGRLRAAGVDVAFVAE